MGDRDIIIEPDAAGLAKCGAEIFCRTARDTVHQKGRFAVALSGGSTPRTMHRLFSEEPYLSRVPWKATHIFWVDERMIPYDHPYSNFGAAKEDFLEKIPILSEHVHPMPVQHPFIEGAIQYHRELEIFFQPQKESWPEFDLIFLGVGKDGHTASLFPGQKGFNEKGKRVEVVFGGDPPVTRLTLTYPVLNHAKQVVFLVTGEEKAEIVRAVLESDQQIYPAAMITPLQGSLTWLLDRPAGAMLQTPTKSCGDRSIKRGRRVFLR